MNRDNWHQSINPELQAHLNRLWVPVGTPGFAGSQKRSRKEAMDERFGPDGWRIGHYVRGEIVPQSVAIREYEESYRVYLRQRPALVDWLINTAGNVYDDNVTNVFDDDYKQPHTQMNHYQDISVRRVIAELVDDPDWPQVNATPVEELDLVDLKDGQVHRSPRANGFRGAYLVQIREPDSPGFPLNPAVVPVHDPALIITDPRRERGWYLTEGCGHLSVEAFWQMSKVIEVRYDRFLALGAARVNPLEGIG